MLSVVEGFVEEARQKLKKRGKTGGISGDVSGSGMKPSRYRGTVGFLPLIVCMSD